MPTLHVALTAEGKKKNGLVSSKKRKKTKNQDRNSNAHNSSSEVDEEATGAEESGDFGDQDGQVHEAGGEVDEGDESGDLEGQNGQVQEVDVIETSSGSDHNDGSRQPKLSNAIRSLFPFNKSGNHEAATFSPSRTRPTSTS